MARASLNTGQTETVVNLDHVNDDDDKKENSDDKKKFIGGIFGDRDVMK